MKNNIIWKSEISAALSLGLACSTPSTMSDSEESTTKELALTDPEQIQFETPVTTAIICEKNKGEYEFELVVHGNPLTHAIIESEMTESLVYEFRWNDEDSTHWDRVNVSNSPKTKISYDALRTFDSLYRLCLSYASVRAIWTYKKGNTQKQIHTEWSDPIGPLYT